MLLPIDMGRFKRLSVDQQIEQQLFPLVVLGGAPPQARGGNMFFKGFDLFDTMQRESEPHQQKM